MDSTGAIVTAATTLTGCMMFIAKLMRSQTKDIDRIVKLNLGVFEKKIDKRFARILHGSGDEPNSDIPREWKDYDVKINKENISSGVEIIEKL